MPSRDPRRPLRELYGTGRWQKFRIAYLAQHPLCVMCQEIGKLEPATVVDHRDPHRGDVAKFWMGPFQALCSTCHNGRKQAHEKTGKALGFDTRGNPLGGW